MEARARRRLALLSSHVNPPAETSLPTCLLAAACASDANGEKEMKKGHNDCVFCKIIGGEAPALKLNRILYCSVSNSLMLKMCMPPKIGEFLPEILVTVKVANLFDLHFYQLYEDDECLCILDSYPLCHGHSLIIPKCHFPSLDATPPSIIGAMCSKVPLISNAVMKATGCDSFNLLVNNGAAAGQVIYHTHIHIIPRKAQDCLWASESLRRRPLKLDQEASQLANRIRESLIFVNNYNDSKGQASSLIAN